MRSSYRVTIKTLTTRLRKRRKELGLTQEDAAERIQIATRHYQKLEPGDLNLTLRTLCRLADALQTVASDLLRRD